MYKIASIAANHVCFSDNIALHATEWTSSFTNDKEMMQIGYFCTHHSNISDFAQLSETPIKRVLKKWPFEVDLEPNMTNRFL